jgi:hypothetical protein
VVSVFSIAVNEQLQVRATRDDIAHAVAKLRAISVEAEKSILALSTLFENLSKD